MELHNLTFHPGTPDGDLDPIGALTSGRIRFTHPTCVDGTVKVKDPRSAYYVVIRCVTCGAEADIDRKLLRLALRRLALAEDFGARNDEGKGGELAALRELLQGDKRVSRLWQSNLEISMSRDGDD